MREVGYFELLRRNRSFRNIWIGDVASNLGDWLNTIAIYTLVRELTGSPQALGFIFIAKLLPFAVAAPFAGLINDRLNRRRLMIGSDLARAVIVLGLVWIDRAEQVPLAYALIAAQVLLSAVFVPARSASLPNITERSELLTANTLLAATWSALLAIGAAAGGFATEWLGADRVFVLDSLTYLVSAFFIYRTVIPQETEAGSGASFSSAVRDIVDGWRQMIDRPRIGRIAMAKGVWALGGGGLVYCLALLGEELMPAATAIGIGLLYTSRGIGTGIGPILARRLFPEERRWPLICGLCIATTGAVYWGVATLPWTLAIVPLIALAHAPSGTNWTLSSVLLQRRTPDAFRGRIFATEFLLLTVIDTASIFAASWVLEQQLLDLRSLFLVLAVIEIATGLAWVALVVPAEHRDKTVDDPG